MTLGFTVARDAEQRALRIHSAHGGIVWPLRFGALSSGEVLLVSGAANPDNCLRAWDPVTGRLLWEVDVDHGCYSLAVVSAPSGADLLAAATEIGVQRWDARSEVPLLGAGEMNPGVIHGVDSYTTDDGRSAIVGAGGDHLVHRWDAVSGERIGLPLAGHGMSVHCVVAESIPGYGVLLATGSEDGTVRCWDAHTGGNVWVSDIMDEDILDICLLVSRAGVSILVSGGTDGVLHRWDAITGRPLGEPIETGEWIGSLALVDIAGEPRIFASSVTGLVRQWHALTGRLIDVAREGMSVDAMACADGRTLVATGTEDGDICVRTL